MTYREECRYRKCVALEPLGSGLLHHPCDSFQVRYIPNTFAELSIEINQKTGHTLVFAFEKYRLMARSGSHPSPQPHLARYQSVRTNISGTAAYKQGMITCK